MLCLTSKDIPEQLASLVTRKTSARAAIPESGLVQEETLMIPTRVETKQSTHYDNGDKDIKAMGYILVQ